MSARRSLEEMWDAALIEAEDRMRPRLLVRLELSCLVPAKGAGEVFVGAHFAERRDSVVGAWTQPKRQSTGPRWPPDGIRIERIDRRDAYDEAVAARAEAWIVRVSRARALEAPYALTAADA